MPAETARRRQCGPTEAALPKHGKTPLGAPGRPGAEAYGKNMFALPGKPGYDEAREAQEARLGNLL